MKIFFIGKRFYTNRDALSEKFGRIYQLPKHWAESGHDVTLWLVDYHSRDNLEASDGSLKIISTPVRNLKIFKHWFFEIYRAKISADLVVASGDCYIGWMGLRVARTMQARFAFDIYDKYDEFSGYYSPPGINLLSYLITNSDFRLFASRSLMENSRNSPSDLLVPNGIDASRFTPSNMMKCRHILKLPNNALLIGYFGSMETDRGIEDLINACTKLHASGTPVQLVLGGKTSPDLKIQQPWIHYLGNIPYDDVPIALSACDLLALPYRRSVFMDSGASNKIAEAIACRRPIVATRTPNLTENFPEQSKQLDPFLAEPSNPTSLARSIQLQAKHRVLVDLPEGLGWEDIARGLIHNLETRLA